MLPPKDENLIRDGLRFKRELDNLDSALSCYRQGLYVLREIYVEKAKVAHSRNKEERASYYMGIVEGIDLSIRHPEVMVRKWENMARNEIYAVSNPDGE